jgi:uncharacterized protein (DUF1800 family)
VPVSVVQQCGKMPFSPSRSVGRPTINTVSGPVSGTVKRPVNAGGRVPAQSDIEHLLRRTEFVARPARVSALVAKPTLADAVDDILAAGPAVTIALDAESNWQRSEQYIHFWLNQMAHDSSRPIREKMSMFWHGHFCSDLSKAGSTELMQEQIDSFRRDGLGNLRQLAKQMSTQVAMIRYLDNNDNRKTSPNQNFGRELMELFLLGVGNYTEADVEASTAAWTGHTDNWETDAYVWRPDWHDNANKTLLGQTINLDKTDAGQRQHGNQVIDTILGAGSVPAAATNVANRGRPTKAVAAEFLSRKLWTAFAGTPIPPAVLTAMRDVALAADFAITPWLRAMLLRPEFYDASVRQGLVRSPVDYMVALLVASGKRSEDASPLWLMEGMGQRPLSPPNVSGWKHNGYYVNASAMAQRTRTAQSFFWRLMDSYWDTTGPEAGVITLPGGTITKDQIIATANDATKARALVDEFLAKLRLTATSTSLNALYQYATSVNRWERVNVLLLILLMPELNVA